MSGRRVRQAALVCALACASSFVSANDDDCEIDKMMRDTRVQMDKMAVGIYENGVKKPVNAAIKSAPSVKDASCLPMLDKLDMLMRMRIPSIGGALGGVMTMIRDMACDMANSYLENMANSVQVGYSDPLGIASIGIGGTTGQGGSQIEEYDLGEVVKDSVGNAVGGAIGGAVSNTAGDLRKSLPTGPSDRRSSINSTINQEVKGAINGL